MKPHCIKEKENGKGTWLASLFLFLSFPLIWMDTDELIKKNEEFDHKLITFFVVRETA